MNPLLLFLFATLFAINFSCTTSKSTAPRSTSGLIEHQILFYDTLKRDFQYQPNFWPKQRIWYQDSLVIAETVAINQFQMMGEMAAPRVTFSRRYTFINLQTREYYRYQHFSDTAQLVRSFIGPDSVGMDGPWNFFVRHGKYKLKNGDMARDTLIEGKRYVVHSGFVDDEPGETEVINMRLYLDCQRWDPLLQFDRELGLQLGCPIVRVDRLPAANGSFSAQLRLISDTLSAEDAKVFKAWVNYAKDNPVKESNSMLPDSNKQQP